MYQPSKIGGADIIDLSVAAEADVAVIAANQHFNSVDTDAFRNQEAPLVVAPATPRRTQRFSLREGRLLNGQKAISFANALPAEDDTVRKPRMVQVYAAGEFVISQADPLAITPFIAMLPTNTPLEIKTATNSWNSVTNELGRGQLFPLDKQSAEANSRGFSCRATLLPIHSPNTVLLVGVKFTNLSAQEVTVRFDFTLSHWRYDSDILSHDPNR